MAKRNTLGANNPLDRFGGGPLDFIDPEPPPPKAKPELVPEAQAEPTPEPELKMLGVRIPVELHQWAKLEAVRRGTTLQDLVTDALVAIRDTE